MEQQGSFNTAYVAGMGALALVLAVVGLTLTGERHTGLVGQLEVGVLVLGAVLFVAAGVGARSSTGASWPLLAAVVGTVVVTVLALLTFTQAEAGSAVFLEVAAAVMGVLLVALLRRG